ncbi:outer membrane beta-barrel family protein [Mangrovibacterium lignilyticum]|uniref:outer membrane beta-barrel family protein n=1 Tax=Mangrovibacterium lignilyticum TaxID=2668052 RepID=UPI0013D1B0F1|nr:outer membrane beta-barrel family protein [Mangrovibacterium lignilyticum]
MTLLLSSTLAQAQIQGSVRDTTELPVPFANVLLLNQADSTVAVGVMATEEGTYNISNFTPGSYLIGVSLIGYEPAYSKPFMIKSSNEHIHRNPMYMRSNSKQIEDVNVVAKKPIYELQIDRMVVNVENSITSSGNTALEVLEKSPGVIVDRQNNSISLAGKSGVMIILNGKQTRMPIEAAMQMLDGMNAENVKKIELITTPPAKYEAEGNAGIINIVLKKHEDFGTNGSFSLGAGVAKREKMNASLNLNHHMDKVNFYGTYNVNYNNLFHQIDSYRRYLQDDQVNETEASSYRDAIRLFQNIRMGFDYTISSKTTLSVLTNGYVSGWDMDAVNDILYMTSGTTTKTSVMDNQETNKWYHAMGNINLQHHFKEEETLDINFDYLNYYNDNPSNYDSQVTDNMGQTTSEIIEIEKTTPIDILVGSLDYSNQVNTDFKIEAGTKITYTLFENDVAVRYLESGGWTYDPELTNKYSMDENIMALYTSVSYKIAKNTSFVGGLRYEYMNSVLDSETEKGIVDLHYGEFFPTLFLSQKLDDKNTLQASYSRRINRPSFNQLAPFLIMNTPQSFISGNVNLLPAFSNIYKIEYQFKSAMLSVAYTDTKDAISRFAPKNSEDGEKQYFFSRNIDKSQTMSATLAIPITITSWWKMQNNLIWTKQKVDTEYDGTEYKIDQDNYRITSNQSFSLSKRLSAEISCFYNSKSIWGIYESMAFGRVDAGLQWKLKNENSRFNLNISDIFKTNIYRSVASLPELNIYNRWRLDFEPRVFRLTFTQNFGNGAVKTSHRTTGSEEEQNRVNP